MRRSSWFSLTFRGESCNLSVSASESLSSSSLVVPSASCRSSLLSSSSSSLRLLDPLELSGGCVCWVGAGAAVVEFLRALRPRIVLSVSVSIAVKRYWSALE